MAEYPVITIIVTALFGGSVSAALTHWFNSNREERIVKREKLEALFSALTKYIKQLEQIHLSYEGVMHKHYSLAVATKQAQNSLDDTRPFQEAVMYQSIYFPSLQDTIRRLTECRKAGVTLIVDLEELNDRQDVTVASLIPRSVNLQNDLLAIHQDLIERVRELAKKL